MPWISRIGAYPQPKFVMVDYVFLFQLLDQIIIWTWQLLISDCNSYKTICLRDDVRLRSRDVHHLQIWDCGILSAIEDNRLFDPVSIKVVLQIFGEWVLSLVLIDTILNSTRGHNLCKGIVCMKIFTWSKASFTLLCECTKSMLGCGHL